MRTLRAIYNHARKAHKSLPADNPVNAVDWNGEKRRDTGMGTSDLKGWFTELAALDNPIRLAEQKEDRATLSKWGNDLRQSFRTIATAAGVSEFDAKLLMNHAIPGVNAGYVTRHKLLEDHLRSQQQAISSAVFAAVGRSLNEHSGIRNWLGHGGPQRLVLVEDVDKDYGQRSTVEPIDRKAA
jgi:hypothetical protein